MRVKKILNNNVVTSNNENGHEIIIMGNGIGWNLKPGDTIDESKVEKTFTMDTATSTARLKQLFCEVRMESIKASSEIVEYARNHLEKELKKNIYITLTDHIDFAVERFQKGITFKTALYWEIQKIYPQEFAISKYALDIIDKHLHVRLPEQEAASIALHLVNAEFDGNMTRTENLIDIVNSILNIVSTVLKIKMDQESLDYQRFVTHLLFFAQRVLDHKSLESQDDILYETMAKCHPKEMQCAKKITKYIEKQYGVTAGNEEISFLTVHIVRISSH